MTNQHSPEPWKAVGLTNNFDGVETYVVSETKQVARVFGTKDCDATEHARRIVACVNACAGIPNEQLECDEVEFVRIFNERNTLKNQRDELLAALEDAVSVAKTAHECWDNDQDMKVGKYLIALSGGLPGYDKRTDEIHAAIASVKGTPK